MKTKIENNKLIAEFMGLVKNDIKYSSGRSIEYKKGAFVDYEGMDKGWLHYHTDWNWLMPVVDKIENGFHWNHSIKIENGYCTIVNFNNDKRFMANSKKEAVYKAVVEFIKWYNKQQK